MKNVSRYYQKVINSFVIGHERSLRAKKNILLLFLFKGLSAIIGLLLVPLILNYLDPIKYGVWLTLYSILNWINFFDIGFGNGLRNKFAEAKARGDSELAKGYVSTTFTGLLLILFAVYVSFIIANANLNWTQVLNAPVRFESEINLLVVISFSFFCVGLLARLIDVVLIADQKPGVSSMIGFIGNFLSLVIILILVKITQSSLILTGITLSASPVLISLIASVYLFSKDYKNVAPSFKYVNWKFVKELVVLGAKFFIIQMSVLLIFTASNIIITQVFGPAQVTVYNIAYKYFSFAIMLFGIILSPFWSAITEAYINKDFVWIKRITGKLFRIWYYFAAGVVIMILFSSQVYKIWVGDKIVIPFSLSLLMGIYVLLINLSNIFTTLINGTGKIKIQLYLSIIMGALSIPIMIFFAKTMELGILGIILGICLILVPFIIIFWLQYNKILEDTAYGLWGS